MIAALDGTVTVLVMDDYNYEALQAVAFQLLTTAPAIADRAIQVGWVTDGDVDWRRLLNEWEQASRAWSDGEWRLLSAVAGLAILPTSGLDALNAAALVSALAAGLSVAEGQLRRAEAGEALLPRIQRPHR